MSIGENPKRDDEQPANHEDAKKISVNLCDLWLVTQRQGAKTAKKKGKPLRLEDTKSDLR